jgi:hypothetical protein
MYKIMLTRVKCVTLNSGTLLAVDVMVAKPCHEENTKEVVYQVLFCSVKLYVWSFAPEYRAYGAKCLCSDQAADWTTEDLGSIPVKRIKLPRMKITSQIHPAPRLRMEGASFSLSHAPCMA